VVELLLIYTRFTPALHPLYTVQRAPQRGGAAPPEEGGSELPGELRLHLINLSADQLTD
jgi:hypothetical protein